VNPAANIKIKNNLLAITLVLTALPASVRVSKEVVEHFCLVLGQYFGAGTERPEVGHPFSKRYPADSGLVQLGLSAIHCGTSFLLASLRPLPSSLPNTPPTPSPILQHAALVLLSPMITFLADAVVDESAAPIEGTRELVKGLVTWCSGLTGPMKARGYSVLLPTLSLLLDPPRSPLHAIATNTMLSLAQTSPAAFRDATMSIPEGDRVRLEKAVREAVGSQGQGKGGGVAAMQGAEKRGIELKSFG